jgi:short-subunit dehydrogenase
MPLEPTVALVTGAGSGIGRALAIDLSRRGARVVLVGRRATALEETRRQLQPGTQAWLCPADITDADARARIARTVGDIGRLDLLVNNAGIISVGPVTATDDAVFARMMATNVLAPFALTRDLLPLLRRSAAARIVNVGSMFGDIAFPHFAAYSSTKFALRGLSDALRRELKPDGIGVTYAAPRAARTEALPVFTHLVEPLGLTLDDPARIARQILDAAAAGRRSVYPAGMERLFVLVARLLPGLVDDSVAKQVRRIQPQETPDPKFS